MTTINYALLREKQKAHYLYQKEIPVEHSVSFPMPTKRSGSPAYVFFASPAIKIPGQGSKQAGPDRWWMIDARSGKLLIYTMYSLFPFAEKLTWPTVDIPRRSISLSDQEYILRRFEALMVEFVDPFFEDQKAETETLKQTLISLITKSLIPQYEGIAPDFFDWLNQ